MGERMLVDRIQSDRILGGPGRRKRSLAGLLLILVAGATACGGGSDADGADSSNDPEADPPQAAQVEAADNRAILLAPEHPAWSTPAPDTFLAIVETTAGDFSIEVVRAWAPIGADRFYNLARHGYYDDARMHRVVPGFITQWGIAGDPEVTAVWYDRGMPDDTVVASNVRGSIAFAFTDPGTRSTQVYINMVDNTRLDATGFAPFGRVIDGMDSVVDSIYSGYGEDSGGGVRRGDQGPLVAGGNAFIDATYPDLDRIIRIRIEG